MTKESYSKSALNAMHRATKQALEKAADMDQIQIYQSPDGETWVDVRFEPETVCIPDLLTICGIDIPFQTHMMECDNP